MPGLRSLRNRLAVIFALIILGAIGTIYLSVTPRLEASLTSQRLDQVARQQRASCTPELGRVPAAARQSPLTEDRSRRQARIKARPRRDACASSPSASAPRSS